jgi:hypothetical protein
MLVKRLVMCVKRRMVISILKKMERRMGILKRMERRLEMKVEEGQRRLM